ncbi:transcriptional regulator GcvA [Crenobacter sp. SG2303]|uniref:Transcriptional regulator GcvA n=1 Tax=Crenobacter oryzisoli TaxID=3056844 RepID=A0ABT7XT78_9NEIS|nr:transcriptional regulator GcvA [Crenobacter sp. SG2303]MDN0076925.1 transcriptional regulator GcvA [Crenobacter sp. SG2303]
MRLPPLNALRVFIAAAEYLSFTRAASALHLTQGAVSRQVQALEAFYGTPLFVRQARGLSLTAEGEALLGPVREAFRLLHEASEALMVRQGDLRVRCPPTMAMRWLLPNLPDFQARYPALTVHLISQLQHDMPFNRALYDLALIGMDSEDPGPGLVAERLSRELLVPVCAPALLDGPHPLREPNDLAYRTLLHPWREQDSWRQWLRLAGATKVDANSGLTFDTLEYALHAAANGMGVTLGQLSMVRDDVERGRLVIPFDTVLETEWSYYLIYPENSAELPKVRAFRDWLHDLLSQEQEFRGFPAKPA